MKKVGRPKNPHKVERLVLQIRMKKEEMQSFAKAMIACGESNRSEFARKLIINAIQDSKQQEENRL